MRIIIYNYFNIIINTSISIVNNCSCLRVHFSLNHFSYNILKERVLLLSLLMLIIQLGLSWSAYWTNSCTRATFGASIRIDNVTVVSGANSTNRTFSFASATANALSRNYICHRLNNPLLPLFKVTIPKGTKKGKL